MSRRGNCHDNAVAERFFQLLKRERIRRRVYATRDDGVVVIDVVGVPTSAMAEMTVLLLT